MRVSILIVEIRGTCMGQGSGVFQNYERLRIVRGAEPGDLPIQTPTRLELVAISRPQPHKASPSAKPTR
jgi:hypothetical protein